MKKRRQISLWSDKPNKKLVKKRKIFVCFCNQVDKQNKTTFKKCNFEKEISVWSDKKRNKNSKEVLDICKGQLNSEWIYEVIVSHKMPTKNYKNFCPTKQTRIVAKKTAYNHQKITKKSAMILVCLVGQKYLKFMVGILWETMTS